MNPLRSVTQTVRSHALPALAIVWLLATTYLPGASVVPSGYTNAFTTQPPSADWATLTISGGSGDSYNPDADVNAVITTGGVSALTLSDSGNPPVANASATWSSSGRYLQARPTGNRATALMAKFINSTGTNATQIRLSYLFTIAGGGGGEENGRGTRAYFSLSGTINSWTNLAALNSTASLDGSSSVITNLFLNWTNGGSFFLLFLDDNSVDGTDSGNQIDNFSLQVTAGTPTNFFCLVATPLHNRALVSGGSIIASALTGNGTPPYTVEYFTNSGAGNTAFTTAGSSGTAPYNVAWGILPVGTHNIYAVLTDSAAIPRTTNSATNTFSVVNPITFALTSPGDGATFDHTTPVSGITTASGGTPPYSVQFHFDNLPSGAPVTSSPYERNFGPLYVGDHTIRATVTDAQGWVSNSLVSTIHIAGPLAAILTPTNGSFPYGTSLSLTAAVAGGTAPYAAEFYVNGQMVTAFNAPPFRTNLGFLPSGDYTCYVHATDSLLSSAYSTTNVLTIRPAPLRIMPVGDSITYGIPVQGGYRAPLYQLLTNAGHEVDFLGTQTGNGAVSLPDSDHEGYSGWTIGLIDSAILNSFAAVADPDIILMMIGVNDYRGGDMGDATNRIDALITKMALGRPNAKIVVANLTECNDPYNTTIQATFNPFLPGICARQRSLGRQVFFHDLRSAVPIADMPDQLHPNQTGYNKMAASWFAAIQALPCTGCPPTFLLQPTNQVVAPGTNVTLSASATGTGPVRYQWRFEGTNIPSATNAAYSFTNVSLTNGHGNFSVAATDDVGSRLSSNAFVFVSIKPGIVTAPVTQTVLQGQNATFICVATGAPPLFYRWIRQGTAVFTNTTGIGVFANVQASLTNSIRCTVQNAAGSATSANVSLFMLADSDGDGMPNAWEIQYGLGASNAADAFLDFDGDGMNNRGEYLSGTDPTDTNSVLKLALSATNTAWLQFVAQTNIGYTIQYRTNLAAAPWIALTNLSPQSQARTVQVHAASPPPTPERYYRVVTPPGP